MSINKVILVGNVGKDPEVKYFDNGKAVANFSLATTERGYTASNGTQVPDRTDWHNIVLWRGLAEIAEKYIRKGSKIYIEGKLHTRSYDNGQGVKRYVTEVWGEVLELLGRKSESENPPPSTEPPIATTDYIPTITTNPSIEIEQEKDDLPF